MKPYDIKLGRGKIYSRERLLIILDDIKRTVMQNYQARRITPELYTEICAMFRQEFNNKLPNHFILMQSSRDRESIILTIQYTINDEVLTFNTTILLY